MAEWIRDGRYHADIWIKGCTEWFSARRYPGWRLYYVNFMFEPLLGPTAGIISRMRKAIEWKFYGRFITEFTPDPRAVSQHKYLPVLSLFPDLPVHKKSKSSIRDVTINGGLHYNGPLLIPPTSHFTECPIKHFAENQYRYCNHGIERIDIKDGFDISGLMDYAAKTIKYGRASEEHIIFLPKSASQLPTKKPAQSDPSERLIKDIQSRFNVSDEMAKTIQSGIINTAERIR